MGSSYHKTKQHRHSRVILRYSSKNFKITCVKGKEDDFKFNISCEILENRRWIGKYFSLWSRFILVSFTHESLPYLQPKCWRASFLFDQKGFWFCCILWICLHPLVFDAGQHRLSAIQMSDFIAVSKCLIQSSPPSQIIRKPDMYFENVLNLPVNYKLTSFATLPSSGPSVSFRFRVLVLSKMTVESLDVDFSEYAEELVDSTDEDAPSSEQKDISRTSIWATVTKKGKQSFRRISIWDIYYIVEILPHWLYNNCSVSFLFLFLLTKLTYYKLSLWIKL